MANATLWWLAAGAAVALELVSGTFYLLMLALGMAAAAVAAHLGAGLVVQLVVAAAVGGGAVVAWRLRKAQHGEDKAAQSNVNVNLDIGESVLVEGWKPDGTAQVHYRGAQWTAIHREGAAPIAGLHRVVELVGNRLVLEKI
jgi:membrane protein implicated in regulation of membrane protease activity